MVLGQDEEIDDSTRDDFRDAGLAHLLAVCGQNVMLLVALALPLAGAGAGGPASRGAALLALIALYVPLAGAGPSLQRAGVMGVAGIAAMAAVPAGLALVRAAARGRGHAGAEPARLGADPGWQLSFAAVAGILAIGRPLAAALARAGGELRDARRSRSRPRWCAVWPTRPPSRSRRRSPPRRSSHPLRLGPVAGLPANLLALPAVAPAMWLGMVKTALGQLAALPRRRAALAELLGPLARRRSATSRASPSASPTSRAASSASRSARRWPSPRVRADGLASWRPRSSARPRLAAAGSSRVAGASRASRRRRRLR